MASCVTFCNYYSKQNPPRFWVLISLSFGQLVSRVLLFSSVSSVSYLPSSPPALPAVRLSNERKNFSNKKFRATSLMGFLHKVVDFRQTTFYSQLFFFF